MNDTPTDTPVAGDIIVGADEIASFLGIKRRQVYNASERGYLPLFRMGSLLCARRTTLSRWIVEQERRGLRPGEEDDGNAGRCR